MTAGEGRYGLDLTPSHILCHLGHRHAHLAGEGGEIDVLSHGRLESVEKLRVGWDWWWCQLLMKLPDEGLFRPVDLSDDLAHRLHVGRRVMMVDFLYSSILLLGSPSFFLQLLHLRK